MSAPEFNHGFVIERGADAYGFGSIRILCRCGSWTSQTAAENNVAEKEAIVKAYEKHLLEAAANALRALIANPPFYPKKEGYYWATNVKTTGRQIVYLYGDSRDVGTVHHGTLPISNFTNFKGPIIEED